jgi:hypothetical protein
MPEFISEEQMIASLLKNACSQAHASPPFKRRLLSQLTRQGEAIGIKKPRIVLPKQDGQKRWK